MMNFSLKWIKLPYVNQYHILKEYFDPIKIREHQLGHTVTVG